MRHVYKIFSLAAVLMWSSHMIGQVNSVQYSIVHNAETSLFDCFLIVNDGATNTLVDRIQFNAQYSIRVPNGASVEFEEFFMPLLDNKEYNGIQPQTWNLTSSVKSPRLLPQYDFYGITPTLGAVACYNDLEEGDVVKLFSLKINLPTTVLNPSDVTLFDPSEGNSLKDEGMHGADFSNGFTLGNRSQPFNGILNMEDFKDEQLAQLKEE